MPDKVRWTKLVQTQKRQTITILRYYFSPFYSFHLLMSLNKPFLAETAAISKKACNFEFDLFGISDFPVRVRESWFRRSQTVLTDWYTCEYEHT